LKAEATKGLNSLFGKPKAKPAEPTPEPPKTEPDSTKAGQ